MVSVKQVNAKVLKLHVTTIIHVPLIAALMDNAFTLTALLPITFLVMMVTDVLNKMSVLMMLDSIFLVATVLLNTVMMETSVLTISVTS